MDVLGLAKLPVKLRGHHSGQHFYNLACGAQGIYCENHYNRPWSRPLSDRVPANTALL